MNIICAIIGAIIFVLCMQKISKILELFPNAKMTKSWKVMRILIVFFLIGYIVNIIAVLMEIDSILLTMQALVYLFGALFVLIIVNLSLTTYKILIESANK